MPTSLSSRSSRVRSPSCRSNSSARTFSESVGVSVCIEVAATGWGSRTSVRLWNRLQFAAPPDYRTDPGENVAEPRRVGRLDRAPQFPQEDPFGSLYD